MLKRSTDRKVANKVTAGGNPAIANAFGLPAGISCPGMTNFCNKICYAGRNQRQYKNVHSLVMDNYNQLVNTDFVGMVDLLDTMMIEFERDCDRTGAEKLFRIHWDGDFFSIDYAKAWAVVAKAHDTVQFWVYTRTFPVLEYITGIDNLTVYVSADPDNISSATLWANKYNVPIATVADTFDEANAFMFGKVYNCPENGKRLPLITEKGSACVRCGVCIEGRGNVAFSRSKK